MSSSQIRPSNFALMESQSVYLFESKLSRSLSVCPRSKLSSQSTRVLMVFEANHLIVASFRCRTWNLVRQTHIYLVSAVEQSVHVPLSIRNANRILLIHDNGHYDAIRKYNPSELVCIESEPVLADSGCI